MNLGIENSHDDIPARHCSYSDENQTCTTVCDTHDLQTSDIVFSANEMLSEEVAEENTNIDGKEGVWQVLKVYSVVMY